MSGSPDTRSSSVSTAGYEDGLGRRSVRFNREVGGMLECLQLRPQFVAFAPALRARAAELARLDDERFARVRDFETEAGGLAVLSELVTGHRLIDILETRQAEDAAVSGIDAALGFLLQAMPALAELHATSIIHGAVAPGRILITANAQVVLLDSIYGDAIARLRLNQRSLWTSFGVLSAPTPGPIPVHPCGDVAQMALCGLLLAAGRPLDSAAHISMLAPLVREVSELAEIRAGASFAEGVGRFFESTLPAEGRQPSVTSEAAAAQIRGLVAHIGEDESLSALVELVCFQPAARPAAAPAARRDEIIEAVPVAVVVPPPPAVPEVVLPEAPVPRPVPAPVPPEAPPAAERPAIPMTPLVPSPPPTPVPVVVEPPTPAPPAIVAETAPVVAPAAAAPIPPVVAAPAAVVRAIVPAPGPPAPVPMPAPVMAPVAFSAPPPVMFTPPPPVPMPAPVMAPIQPRPLSSGPATPAILIRQDTPTGYSPQRTRESTAAARPVPAGAVPVTGRAGLGSERPRVRWQVAAAAVLVMSVGILAGRTYLLGDSAAASETVVPVTPSSAPAQAAPTGSLAIDSQPSGARVALDGKEVGVTPLTLEAVAAGRHQVTVTSGSARVQRTVRVEAGQQAAVNVPVFSGWVAIFAPILLDVSEGSRNLGTTENGRIILPPGRHVLTLSNSEFGYRVAQTVDIQPGEERVINVRPTGRVNLNASPWAEVWVDGTRAGETPLANLEVPLGTREFLFKHPQYGERRLTATITTSGSALTVDFGRPPSRP